MKKLLLFPFSTFFILIILVATIVSCNKSSNNDELMGNYGFESNGQVQISITKDGDSYYMQFPGSNNKEIMIKISDADCSRILGAEWRSNFISGLHSGAFFIFKVNKGCVIQGALINSGYFGALPGAGQIWKIR